MQQQVFTLPVNSQARLEDFIDKREIIERLSDFWYNQDGQLWSVVYGPSGCGKSYLLRAWAHSFHREGKLAMYLPLAGYLHKSPDVLLSGIDHFDYIMIDNAELVSGVVDWQKSLCKLYQDCQLNGTKVMFAMQTSQ